MESYATAAAAVLVALIGFVAARSTKKGATQAGVDADRIDRGVVSTEALLDVVRSYEARIEDLEGRTSQTERDLDAMARKHRAAIRYIDRWREYARTLQALIVRHAPDEPLPLPPAVPDELVDDLRED